MGITCTTNFAHMSLVMKGALKWQREYHQTASYIWWKWNRSRELYPDEMLLPKVHFFQSCYGLQGTREWLGSAPTYKNFFGLISLHPVQKIHISRSRAESIKQSSWLHCIIRTETCWENKHLLELQGAQGTVDMVMQSWYMVVKESLLWNIILLNRFHTLYEPAAFALSFQLVVLMPRPMLPKYQWED